MYYYCYVSYVMIDSNDIYTGDIFMLGSFNFTDLEVIDLSEALHGYVSSLKRSRDRYANGTELYACYDKRIKGANLLLLKINQGGVK